MRLPQGSRIFRRSLMLLMPRRSMRALHRFAVIDDEAEMALGVRHLRSAEC